MAKSTSKKSGTASGRGNGQGSKSPARPDKSSGPSSKSGSTGRASNNSRNISTSSRGSSSGGGTSSSRAGQNGSSRSKQQDHGLMKLFTEQLQDVYYVEKQLVRGLTRMAKAANSDELRNAFEEHREETETQMERLEEIFEMLDRSPKGKKCEAMDGLLEEAKELMDDFKGDEALDAALVAAAQKVEHYEIATYGSLCAWAEQLGLEEAVPLLEETLQEEKQTDQNLTELAVSMLNDRGGEKELRSAGSGNKKGSGSR